jgi:putative transposase
MILTFTKVEFNEGTIVKANRFYPSSKKYCKCGAIKQELKLSERIYNCSFCVKQ